MRTKVPCKDCNDRYLGCHAECTLYKEYTDTRQVIKDNRKKYNDETEEQMLSVFRCLK